MADDWAGFGKESRHIIGISTNFHILPMRFRSALAAALAPFVCLALALILVAALSYPLVRLSASTLGITAILSRGTLLLLFAGLILGARRLGIGWRSVGFPASYAVFVRQIGIGLGLGLVMLGLHVAVIMALDIRVFSEIQAARHPSIPVLLLKHVGVALLLATSEELLFRGLTFAILAKFVGPAHVIAITSFYYTLPHFLRSRLKLGESELNWDSGFTVLADAVGNGITEADFSSFLALLCAGVFLGCMRARTVQGLGYCIGIHAGWVFVIKTCKSFTHDGNAGPFGVLVGSYDAIIGYLSAGWISACTVLFLFATRSGTNVR
ncbi:MULTISPECIES: CPBP family intramembrane glutamic endopeptidase [unclassified Methylococcus]|uniref:CPBP family intramembrane glutamic endopeptidase n=1 Tax=unclassified Methylococcus TaxID=2618889 RepID=UPI003D7D94F6